MFSPTPAVEKLSYRKLPAAPTEHTRKPLPLLSPTMNMSSVSPAHPFTYSTLKYIQFILYLKCSHRNCDNSWDSLYFMLTRKLPVYTQSPHPQYMKQASHSLEGNFVVLIVSKWLCTLRNWLRCLLIFE